MKILSFLSPRVAVTLIAVAAATTAPALQISQTLVAASAADSFSELRLDESGNAFYVRTSAGVRGIEKSGFELLAVGDLAPWDASLTLSYLAPAAARKGRIFCQGTVTGPGIDATNDHVSFLAGGLTPQLVTQEGTTDAPGTGTDVVFTGPAFSSMRVRLQDRISMVAGLSGPGVVATLGDPARNVEGLWMGGPASLDLVVRVGSVAPGFSGNEILHQIIAGDGGGDNYAPVNGGGSLAFLSEVLLDGGSQLRAIYRQDGIGGVTLVTRDGDPIPGGGSFNTLKAPALSRNNALVFSDINGIYSTASGSPLIVAKKWGSAPGGGLFTELGPPVVADYVIAFTGETTTPPQRRLFLVTADTPLTALVQQDDPAPNTTATFERFRTLPMVNACGQVAFLAELNQTGGVTAANDEGIWIFDRLGSGILVAREGDSAAPFGYSPATIAAVHLLDDGITNQRPSLDGSGVTVFNDRSQLLYSLELSDGTELVVLATFGPQCELIFRGGFESGGFNDWSASAP